MIQREAWYKETEQGPPTLEQAATSLWSDFVTRDPKPSLKILQEGNALRLELESFVLYLRPVAEEMYQILKVTGKLDLHPTIQEDYGFFDGATVGRVDLYRFVHDFTEPSSWQDQVASRGREADSKYLLEDKRSKRAPKPSNLKVKSFMPHFGVGPTYYGLIDTSCQSWLKDHEYKTEAEARKALARCKSGKAPMEYRGF